MDLQLRQGDRKVGRIGRQIAARRLGCGRDLLFRRLHDLAPFLFGGFPVRPFRLRGLLLARFRAAGVDETAIAVTSVPDAKRGERLVVIHTAWPHPPAEACRKLLDQNLPRLWVPNADDFIQVESIPVLGSGKLDLRRIKEIALGGKN